MSIFALTAYLAAAFAAAATPGPSMFAVISTAIVKGTRPALAVGLGVAFGDVMLLAIVLVGLAAIAAAFGWMIALIKYAGAAYLVWIGIQMWRSTSEGISETRTGTLALLRSTSLGLAIAIGNPKAILFHLSLMPLLLPVEFFTPRDIATVMASVFLVNMIVMGAYALMAGRTARWFRTPARLRAMHRVGGGVMAGTGVLIATRP